MSYDAFAKYYDVLTQNIDYDELDTNFLIEELQIRDYVIFKNADYESIYSYLQDNEFIENSED